MAVLNVTPRRTVGISGLDVGKVSGMGLCSNGFDEYDMPCTDFTPITSDPASTARAIDYLYTPQQQQAGIPTQPSGGVNWTQLFSPLTQAAGAIGSGYAASQLKPGQSLATPGTVITGAGTTLPGSNVLGLTGSSSSLLPIMLLGGAALLIFMGMRR